MTGTLIGAPVGIGSVGFAPRIIPSYAYQQYADDDDVRAFVRAFNELAQSYLDWDNAANLPIYQGLYGAFLDWVALGLYGQRRPSLPYGVEAVDGPLNTWVPNSIVPNAITHPARVVGEIEISFAVGVSPIGGFVDPGTENFATSDDTFKRVMTWNYLKGDGRAFNVRWLKRRVERFLTGTDGRDPGINQTYDVSVVFGRGNLVNIILVGGPITVERRAIPNGMRLNSVTPNGTVIAYASARGRLLRAAVQTGALQLPFQYRYAVYG